MTKECLLKKLMTDYGPSVHSNDIIFKYKNTILSDQGMHVNLHQHPWKDFRYYRCRPNNMHERAKASGSGCCNGQWLHHQAVGHFMKTDRFV